MGNFVMVNDHPDVQAKTEKRSIYDATRVCIFAHYHHLGLAAGYAIYYLDKLRQAGFFVVVVSTADCSADQEDKLRSHCDTLIKRSNSGLDFGGWIEALGQFPGITPDLVLLTNDSVYGPITDLERFIAELEQQPADFYGAVESLQVMPHLQSWFLLLRPSAYQSAAFRRLMHKGPDQDTAKFDIITDYEVGLSQALRQAGLTFYAPFSPAGRGALGARWPTNPMQLFWRPLIERYGIPFLKVELLRYNPSGVDVSDAIAVVERRNPELAALIREDCRERGFVAPKAPRFYWKRALEHLARDVDLPPGSMISRLNAIMFRFWWHAVLSVRGLRRFKSQKLGRCPR